MPNKIHLLNKVGINTAAEAVEILKSYFPVNLILPKTMYLIGRNSF